MERVALVPVFVSVMATPGITAPVVSATCPEIVPAVCADNLAADDIAKMNTKMQQAMNALHRPRLSKVFRAICARPSDVSVTWELEKRKDAKRPFLNASPA